MELPYDLWMEATLDNFERIAPPTAEEFLSYRYAQKPVIIRDLYPESSGCWFRDVDSMLASLGELQGLSQLEYSTGYHPHSRPSARTMTVREYVRGAAVDEIGPHGMTDRFVTGIPTR